MALPSLDPQIKSWGRSVKNWATQQAPLKTGVGTINPATLKLPQPVSMPKETMSNQFVGPTATPTPPLGVRATSPDSSIKPPSNTLPASQAAPIVAPSKSQPSVPTLTPTPSQNQQALTQGGTTTATSPAQPVQQPQQPMASPQGGLYGALVAALAGRGMQDSPEVVAARNALTRSQMEQANALAANAMNPIPLEFQQGRGQVLQTQYGQQQQALSNALQSAVSTQGQQIGALQGAAGFAQPVSQFGMLTNPITGTPLNTQVFNGALNSALQLVNSGTPASDPSVTSLLAPFGFVGPLAFTQAMQAMSGGGWNPAAQSAAAGQNIAYGQMTLQQAQALNTPMATLDALQPKILDVLARGQINPTNIPAWNAQIGTYLSQANPAAYSQWQSIANEIRTLGGQILAARNPGTPTTQDELLAAQDPSQLTGAQLRTVLDTWSALGNTAKGVLQGISSQALGGQYGFSGGLGSMNIPQAGQTMGTNNPLLQGGIGLGMNAPSAVMQIGSGVLNALGLGKLLGL